MKTVLAALALVFLYWSATSALGGQWGTAAGCAFGFFLAVSWLLSVHTAEKVFNEDEEER